MSDFIQIIKQVVEQAVYNCNIPVRQRFPINIISSSVAFTPKRCVVEVLITQPVNDDDMFKLGFFMRNKLLGRYEFSENYYPPSGTNTGSIIYRFTKA